MPERKLTIGQWIVCILSLDFHRFDPGLVEEWQAAHARFPDDEAVKLAAWRARHGDDDADAESDDMADATLADDHPLPDTSDVPVGLHVVDRTAPPPHERIGWGATARYIGSKVGLGIAAILAVVVFIYSIVWISHGGWREYIAWPVMLLDVLLVVLRVFRGPLKLTEAEFSDDVNDASVRLRFRGNLPVPLSRDETVLIAQRRSLWSLLHSPVTADLSGRAGGVAGRHAVRVGKDIQRGFSKEKGGGLITLITVVIIILVLRWLHKEEIHILTVLFVFMALTIAYRIERWRVEVFVLTNERVIFRRGLARASLDEVAINEVASANAIIPVSAQLLGYGRLTRVRYGVLIIKSTGEDQVIIGFLPGAFLLAASILLAKHEYETRDEHAA